MKKGGAQSLVRFPAFYYVCLLWLFVGLQVVSETRAYLPLIDLIPDQLNAYALVKDFRIPWEGCVSSYGGVNPPGITLGFVPGAILFPRDPYLGEKLGAILMFGLALLGLVKLLARFRSNLLVVMAVTWFVVSVDGRFYAQSLWGRAHPAFAVWFLYFVVKWCVDRDRRALAIAVLAWMVGMYWFMEIAPLILVVPVCLLVFRASFDWKSLAVCVSLGVVLWLPFLVFQAERGGFDLRRNLLERRQVENADQLFDEQKANPDLRVIEARPAGWAPDWSVADPPKKSSAEAAKLKGRYINDPDLGWVWSTFEVVRGFDNEGQYINLLEQDTKWSFQRKSDGAFFVQKGGEWPRRVIDHFIETGAPIPRAQVKKPWSSDSDRLLGYSLMRNFGKRFGPLVSFTLGIALGIGLLSAETLRRPLLRFFEACAKHRRALVGAALVGLGVPAFLVFGGDVESETVWLLVGAWAALIVVSLVTWRRRGMDGAQGNDRGMRDAAAILAIAFLVCLSFNVMTIPRAEWSFSSRRFFWLTCLLGTAVFSAIWVALVRIRRFGKPIFLAVSLGLTVLAAQKSSFLSDSNKVFKTRQQHEGYDVLDFLKQDSIADGVTEVPIGYDVSFPKWILVNRHYKDKYKIGWDWDVVLEHRYGIHNTNQLPAGVSKGDRYRIVELVKWDAPWDWPSYFVFDLSDYPRMKVVKRWEKYALLKSVNAPQTGLPASSQQPHD